MSEFSCRFGHLMRPSSTYCEECEEEGRPNQRAIRMDGHSNYELRKMEEEEEREEESDNYREVER